MDDAGDGRRRPTAQLDEIPEGLAATADCSGEVADRDLCDGGPGPAEA